MFIGSYNDVLTEHLGKLTAQFVHVLVFFHKLPHATGVVHGSRYVGLQLAQAFVQIVHAEVVEQMFHLSAQTGDTLFLLHLQLFLRLRLLSAIVLCKKLQLVNAQSGGCPAYLYIIIMNEILFGYESPSDECATASERMRANSGLLKPSPSTPRL